MYKANISKEKIVLLVSDAASSRAKSAASTRGVVMRFSDLVKYYMELQGDNRVELSGERSLVLHRGNLESLSERGHAVHADAKRAMTVSAVSLDIDWPLTNPLLLSAEAVVASERPCQAAAMAIQTVRKLENLESDKLTKPYKRAFASGALLVTWAILSFTGLRRVSAYNLLLV